MSKYIAILNRWYWGFYTFLLLGAIFAFQPAKDIMVNQETSFIAIMSGLTLNIILLYFIWGAASDRASKTMFGKRAKKQKWTEKKVKRTSWLVFGIGLIVLTIALRFVGGLPTIFG